MKPWFKSKTFYAAFLTGCVVLAEYFFPEYKSNLEIAKSLLIAAGLWFVRLGAGKPIGNS